MDARLHRRPRCAPGAAAAAAPAKVLVADARGERGAAPQLLARAAGLPRRLQAIERLVQRLVRVGGAERGLRRMPQSCGEGCPFGCGQKGGNSRTTRAPKPLRGGGKGVVKGW